MCAQCEKANGEIYNLGGKSVLSLRQLADLVIEENGGGTYQVKEFPAERGKIDIGDYYCDWSKIRDELGWAPQTGERAGVRATLEFYRANLKRYL